MENNILLNLGTLAAVTGSNHLRWEQIRNTDCLVSNLNRKKYILCKYTFPENGQSVISFNYLDDDNSIVGDLNEWNERQPEFSKLNELYELAKSHAALQPAINDVEQIHSNMDLL